MTSFLTGGMGSMNSGPRSREAAALEASKLAGKSFVNKDFVKNIAFLNQTVDIHNAFLQKLQKGVEAANMNILQEIQGFWGDLLVLFAGLEPTGVDIGDVKYIFQALGSFFGINPETPFPMNLLDAAGHFFTNFLAPLEQLTDLIFDAIVAWSEDLGLSTAFVNSMLELKDAIEQLGGTFADVFNAVGELLSSFGLLLDWIPSTPLGAVWDALEDFIDGMPVNLIRPVLFMLSNLGVPFIQALTFIVNTGSALLNPFSLIAGSQISTLGDNVVPPVSASTTMWSVGSNTNVSWVYDEATEAFTTIGNSTAKRVLTQAKMSVAPGQKITVKGSLRWDNVPAAQDNFGIIFSWYQGLVEKSATVFNVPAGHGVSSGGTFAQSVFESGVVVPVDIDSVRIGAHIGTQINTGQVWAKDISAQLEGYVKISLIEGLLDIGGKIYKDLLDVPVTIIQGLLTEAGTFVLDLIPGLDATKIISGEFAQEMVTGLQSALSTLGSQIDDVVDDLFQLGSDLWNNPAAVIQQIPQALVNLVSIPANIISGLLSGANIPTLDASKITAGVFDLLRLPNIPLSMITGLLSGGGKILENLLAVPISVINGLFDIGGAIFGSLIPDLDATKIVSGQMSQARVNITSIAAGIISGTLGVANIPNLNADKITAGVLNVLRVPDLAISKITGLLSGGTILGNLIPDLDASKIISGQMDQARVNITSIAASIISGTLATVNIPSLNADKITGGVLNALRIPDLAVSKITGLLSGGKILESLLSVPLSTITGLLDVGGAILGGLIPDLDASKIISGQMAQARVNITSIAASIVSGVLAAGNIPSLNADKITAGVLNVLRVPDLSISKITGLLSGTGTFLGSLIPDLDASKIISGQMDQARVNITSIAASIVSGVLGTANIPNLNASKINAGVLNVLRIPDLAVGKITGLLSGTGKVLETLLSVPTSVITGLLDVGGTILGGLIPDLDASKIISGVLIDPVIPDIKRGMSSDLQGVIDAGINALRNTPGTLGQAFEEWEQALSSIPTQIFNKFGGNNVPRASQAQANQAMQTLQNTINSHASAISQLQSIVDGANGFREVITFKQSEVVNYTTAGAFNYTIPSWAKWVDAVYLSPGGGGAGGSPIIPVHGRGGGAGQWATETLARGTDFPSGATNLTGNVGAGGARGLVNSSGSAGGNNNRDAISGGKAAFTVIGGPGGSGLDTNQAKGNSPGDVVYQGVTYPGGEGGNSHAGQNGRPGGPGAGGGGGAGATWFVGWAGGPGGDGQIWFTARAEMPAAFTSMGNLILPTYKLNTGVAQTDSQTVAAVWGRNPPANGNIIILRANSGFTNYVYLRKVPTTDGTAYELGKVSSGVATPWKYGNLSEAIPFNAFSLTCDEDYTFTVGINGSGFDSYTDAAHSSSRGELYRHGGWGTSEVTKPGSIIQFAFFDSGTPSRITSSVVATAQGTASATYTDLATTGPAVTINVPPSGEVAVDISAQFSAGSANQQGYMGFVLSGSNTLAADDIRSAMLRSPPVTTGDMGVVNRRVHLKGLNPGTTTIKCVYRSSTGTATFSNRNIIVDPKP